MCGAGESYSDVIIRLVAARPAYMKAVREFWLARTIMVIGAMFVWAQAHSQDLACNNSCGAYAEYALAERLHLPASIQNMPRAKIEAWFSHRPQYSSRLDSLAAECESSCTKMCGLDMPMEVAH
jgi:hypothetical protein